MNKDKSKNINIKPAIQVRRNRTGTKKRMDLFANLRNDEHPLDNILPLETIDHNNEPAVISNEDNVSDRSGQTGLTGLTTPPGLTEPTTPTGLTGLTTPSTSISSVSSSKVNRYPVSPTRDFTKTPNSLTRIVLAQGLFRGKSKQIYDFLWSASRGAINPQRIIRKTQKQIQKGSGVGSLNTIKDGLKHLESIGLIKITSAVGEALGNEYEIFTPEELDITGLTSPTGLTNLTGITDTTEITQNLVGLGEPVSGLTGSTQTNENKPTYENSNTLFKDINRDDEAFAGFIHVIQTASMEIIGKRLSKSDSDNLVRLAELLALELRVAAHRTKNISSIPAFLTEVLRRKIGNSPLFVKAEGKTKIKSQGKAKLDREKFEVKPLNDEEKNITLLQLQEFAEEDFLEDFKKWYTEEDWNWLMSKIEK